MGLAIVIPTLNEELNVATIVPLIKFLYPSAKIFVVDDLSKDKTVEQARACGAIVPYTFEFRNYGRSLIEGITMAYYEYGCDEIIQMDADHPVEELERFLKAEGDLIIGSEFGKRFTRGFACWLARKFLKLDFRHPTCGLRLWRERAIKRINWRKIKAKGFSVQIETLYRAKKKGLKITEVEFEGKGHERLSVWRVFEWLSTFFRLLIWGWSY